MNENMIQGKIAILFSILLLLVGSLTSKQAQAEEIVITANGSESVNEVASATSNTTNIETSNTTNVDNNVDISSNTGGNSASGNTGGSTQVTTGNTAVSTDIQNQANSNVVNTEACCTQKGTMTIISGNGTGSKNTVTTSSANNVSITSTNTANIVNNVTVNANTGNNTANNNTGNVYLKTGNISVRETIKNAPVNLTWIDAAIAQSSFNKSSIIGNGSYSDNTITAHETTNTDIFTNNIADIINNTWLDLNTGHNEANDNTGDVYLATGDIKADVLITNEVNKNDVTVTCDCKENPQPTPAPAAPVEKVTTNAPSGSSSPTHEVAGISMSNTLPVTGTNWLFLAFIGNVMMLFLGMILRLRSGNSPGVVAVA